MTRSDIVKRVLTIIASENVDAIGDTVESSDVADFLDIVYDEVMGSYPWPFLRRFHNLTVSGAAAEMHIPTDVYNISRVYYDGRAVGYLTPEDMFELLSRRLNSSVDNIDSQGAKTNQDPKYWTTFDGAKVTFDGYDGALETSKAVVHVIEIPSPMTNDSDVPALPRRWHNVLIYGTAALASYNLLGDDSIGDRYQALYTKQLVKMQRWGRMADARRHTTMPYSFGRLAGRLTVRRNYGS